MIHRIDKIEHTDKIAIVSIIIPFEEFKPGMMNFKTMTIKARDYLILEEEKWNKKLNWDTKPDPQSQHDVEEAFVSFYGKEALEEWKKGYSSDIKEKPYLKKEKNHENI